MKEKEPLLKIDKCNNRVCQSLKKHTKNTYL